ncbi:AMP-dependent synthetase and ligase [Cupriavidus basilensis OR16]|uniref:AMP-dependent synthetase and ligase n=1 Tax=Cupriavidus basilensis OR16 TaxID=1127483 RepID=H1S901_9BURK|nr:fatty acid--CoA ligase [Cupriavidus basilensis]EHP41017.1 AMP-dependent synthetase and ligase [Cupriavidus basilensis OR16]
MQSKETRSRPAGSQYPLLIKQLLLSPLTQAPDQSIVYRDNHSYTYRALRERIGRLASGLQSLGVGHGDTVAVLDWDSHRYLECFLAVPMMGAVLMTANIRLSPQQLQYTLEQSKPKVLLVHRDFLELVESFSEVVRNAKCLLILDDEDDCTAAGGYEALLARSRADFRFPDFDENTCATLFYTSGTTGLPKGVSYSHRQIVLHTLAVCAAFAMPASQGRFHRGDVYMPLTPMFHVHAWGMPYVATMMGVKQVYPGRYTPEGILALRAREGVTFSHCVPTILQMLLDRAELDRVDLSEWKIVVGGASFPTSLASRAVEHGIDAFAAYGMSETCPFVTSSHLEPSLCATDDSAEAITSRTRAGRALPLMDIQIVDAAMQPVPEGNHTQGEIVLRAPWLTQAYHMNASASEELWRGGYLHTGDIGLLDEAGYLRITDRLKDVIKTGGEWLSSSTLEDLIRQHQYVREAAVIAVPDSKWGERPMAIVVAATSSPGSFDATAIRNHLSDYVTSGHIPKYAIPETIHFVDDLPRTSVGKYDKRAMRERYQHVGGPS